MATSPSQTPEDLATPAPYAPTDAEIKHRLLQLQSHPSQQNRNPPPVPEHPEQPEPPPAASPQPPTPLALEKAALHGPAGRIVNTLAPHTEAHPAALLLQFLAAFGNLIGPGPHCMVESTRHALNLFVVLVGDSSKARKGTSWNLIANLFAGVDPSWLSTRVNGARLTANGLVRALRDQQPPTDRRLLAISEEFATVVHSLKRGNGHLSPLLRCAWDNGNLPTLDMHHQYAPPAPTSASSRISPSGSSPKPSSVNRPITALPIAVFGHGSSAATASLAAAAPLRRNCPPSPPH